MRILLIEDDEELCEALSFQLINEGFAVDVCHDGNEGLTYLRERAHDLVLLDRMLPSISGTEILTQIRDEGISTPVILVTALGELQDKVKGLDSGADDYITKPFDFQELMARIRSITRRPRQWENSTIVQYGDLAYDSTERKLSGKNQTCTLSKKEGDLLELFLKNPDKILPRMLILSRVWGPYAEVEDGNLDNYIHFLRRRLSSVKSTLSLKTVRGIGYRLEVGNA
jgi:Response regulators consisting of a CheY-like receiver domain and a winged-helix DNA-binding domain